ncbi:bifunctional metallophosphatase/5'-nucleotidase [Rubrobacter tropicus]|uniref:Bifunctional metallophosphatase/5'-nucleotidase n=1 Tax=Rubrobacter tropicus TaxID=2653851 RepID=A0A6G8QCY5_9ACTN|nr:5'-nucleotidase C-terminal domain-containing protein [Rubrobacter tropicus]QIN84298.1 bifunctional metallophosphatase/5'-nucleotidase [Rubrobacter tropicus]
MVVTLRAALLPITLALALMLALLAILASGAESKPKPTKPVPEDRTSNIQLLGVNDFHGQLEPTTRRDVPGRTLGGAAYLDAYFDRYEARNPERTIRVHAGDMVGASPLISSYFHDEPSVYAMNEMEMDVGTLGNHEFDEGGEEMLRLINGGQRSDGNQFKDGPDGEPINTSDPDFDGADFPYVAANTEYKDSGETVLPPYKIVKKDGINVGFIGVTTLETPNIVTPDAVAPFDYLDISETVNRYVAELKRKKVETVVVLAHAGGAQTTATEAVGEIVSETQQMSDEVDVVVSGHSHSQLNNRVGNKLIVQAFSLGTAFDAVNMKIDRRTKDVVSSSAEIVNTFNDAIAPDPATAELVAGYKDRIDPIANRVVGTAAENVVRTNNAAGESPLGQLIADAQRDFAGTQLAFMNPGGIRADIAAGEVTYAELFAVQPFDNQVVRLEMTGDQVYRVLEQQFQTDNNGNPRTRILQVSGLEFSYNSTNPAGQRITSVTLPGGTPLDRAATYTVAANSFIATGGDGFTVFKEGQNPNTLGSDLDALEGYIDGLPSPFPAPDPNADPRITKQG